MEYPERPSFFAHRFCRVMAKTCAAQEIGPEACWMLTVIAQTEDAKHYSGAVTYWNEQLMVICGFASKGRLMRARGKAIECGWLHYVAGSRGQAGTYWVMIPTRFGRLDDAPTDEANDEYDDGIGSKIERQTVQKSDSSVPKSNGKRTESGTDIEPYPDGKRSSFYPDPNPAAAGGSIFDSLPDLSDTSAMFDWFNVVTAGKDKPAGLGRSAAGFRKVIHATENAIRAGDHPLKLFRWIVSGCHWDTLKDPDDLARADARITAFEREQSNAKQLPQVPDDRQGKGGPQ